MRSVSSQLARALAGFNPHQAYAAPGYGFFLDPYLRPYDPVVPLTHHKIDYDDMHECAIVTHTIITPLGDRIAKDVCVREGHTMPKSTEKTILFARVTIDRKVHQRPVAVFNTPQLAKAHAKFLHLAHKTGDDAMVLNLDPGATKDSEGKLVSAVTYSVATVPYEPAPDFGEMDTPEVGAASS